MGLMKWGVALAIIKIAVLWRVLIKVSTPDLPVVVDGYYHPAFEPVAKVFRENVESGKEPGAAFAVYHKGECVFDMWGGYADVGAERPWRQNTMTQMFSAGKGVTAIVIASLVDRKLLDYSRPVTDYWPEFGQSNKGNITVEMLMSHQAGLVLLDTPVTSRDVLDNPQKIEQVLASQSTVWPAGSGFGYHAITYGLYADTLVRKVDPKGRTIQQVFLEDIARPHDIDMFLNTPREEFYRAARLHTSPTWKVLFDAFMSPKYLPLFGNIILFPDSLLAKACNTVKEYGSDVAVLNDPYLREVTITSASATGTARGLAKLYGVLVKDGLKSDNAILTTQTTKKLTTALVSGVDKITQATVAFGPGMVSLYLASGHGGQMGIGDPSNNLGIGYLTNFISIYGMGDDPRYTDLENALYKCLDDYLSKTLLQSNFDNSNSDYSNS